MSMIRKLITLIAAFAALGAVSIANAQRGDPALMQARAQGIVGDRTTTEAVVRLDSGTLSTGSWVAVGRGNDTTGLLPRW